MLLYIIPFQTSSLKRYENLQAYICKQRRKQFEELFLKSPTQEQNYKGTAQNKKGGGSKGDSYDIPMNSNSLLQIHNSIAFWYKKPYGPINLLM